MHEFFFHLIFPWANIVLYFVLRQQDWVGMKFLIFTGSQVRNEKFHICLIDYVQNFLLKDYLS